jgi:hypothetical protein
MISRAEPVSTTDLDLPPPHYGTAPDPGLRVQTWGLGDNDNDLPRQNQTKGTVRGR